MILRQQDFRRVTNHASPGQEVRDEARVRDRAPQTARSELLLVSNVSFKTLSCYRLIGVLDLQ